MATNMSQIVENCSFFAYAISDSNIGGRLEAFELDGLEADMARLVAVQARRREEKMGQHQRLLAIERIAYQWISSAPLRLERLNEMHLSRMKGERVHASAVWARLGRDEKEGLASPFLSSLSDRGRRR